MPRFSIIIPVYNAEKYLREALDSVLAQTCADWECVCVDDGSWDGSPAILDEYAARDARFRVVHQANAGVSVARNVGLGIAQGDLITWLDADDVYAPWRLEEAWTIIAKEESDVVRFRTVIFEQGARCDFRRGGYRVLTGDDAKVWGWNEMFPAGMMWTMVARSGLYNGVRFVPAMRVKEESAVCASIALRVTTVAQSESVAYAYRQVVGSAMHSIRRADDCLCLLQAMREFWKSISGLRSEGLSNRVLGVMKCRLRAYCEDDIKDWVWMRKGEWNRTREIYALYGELKDLGVFECPSIIHWRPLEWALGVWDKTGRTWALCLVGCYVMMGRRLHQVASQYLTEI